MSDDTSMENLDPFDLVRLTVLMEEVGEVARALPPEGAGRRGAENFSPEPLDLYRHCVYVVSCRTEDNEEPPGSRRGFK
jgi:NTP pyrophosphatase (non-canonical NTP hydrolase)